MKCADYEKCTRVKSDVGCYSCELRKWCYRSPSPSKVRMMELVENMRPCDTCEFMEDGPVCSADPEKKCLDYWKELRKLIGEL